MRTRSCRDRQRTTSPNTNGIGANLPGQSLRLWGHASQVAAWGAHSAGMRKPREAGADALAERLLARVEETFGDRRVRIDSSVAEEGPVAAHALDMPEVASREHDLLFVARGLR